MPHVVTVIGVSFHFGKPVRAAISQRIVSSPVILPTPAPRTPDRTAPGHHPSAYRRRVTERFPRPRLTPLSGKASVSRNLWGCHHLEPRPGLSTS